MLKLTKRTEYGLIALIHLADREGDVVSVREIGEHYPVPKRLLGEALKALHHAGIVDSARGASGGFWLARPAGEVSLGEVVTALEGAPALTGCGGLSLADKDGECEVTPVCRIRSPLQRIRQGIWALLEGTSLRSLASSSAQGSPQGSPPQGSPPQGSPPQGSPQGSPQANSLLETLIGSSPKI